jgi:tetratricopeptide (TPR) repeat protein
MTSTHFYSYFYETAQYNLGFQVVDQAKTLADKTTSTGLDPTTLSHVYLNHGSLCKEINEPGQAIDSLVRALALFEKAIETQASLKESNHLANLHSELGCAYTGAERFNEAEECHKKAISLCKGGPKDVARLYANLGSCYLWKGDLQQAEAVLHKALLEYDRVLECNLYALGNVYLKQKRYKEALEKHQEVLERFSKKLGHDHHVTADSCHKIGSILAIPDFESGIDLVEAE